MQIFNQLNINKGLVLALGFFDGIHLGHQAVLKSAVDYAKKNDLKSAVLTFKNSPACYFHHYEPKYLVQNREKYIEDLEIDFLYEIDFNSDLANMSAEDYLKDVLIKYFEPKAIFTGFNVIFFLRCYQQQAARKLFLFSQKLKSD